MSARGKDGPLFFMDRSLGDGEVVYEENSDSAVDEHAMVNKGRKPVWVDDEEEKTEVDIIKVARLRKLRNKADECVISGKEFEASLRGHHAKLNPFTSWAGMDHKDPLPGVSDDESDDDGRVDNILRNNNELVV